MSRWRKLRINVNGKTPSYPLYRICAYKGHVAGCLVPFISSLCV